MNKLINAFKENSRDIIKPTAVLLAICIIIPLALSLTNKITAKKISLLEEENSRKAMSNLIKADSFEPVSDMECYKAAKDGSVVGYIFKTSSKGYGGDVSVMTAVNPDGTVKSVAILDVSGETPGLGQNAAKESFYSQYAGKKSGISLLKNGADKDKNEVNAVTGATITSTAVNRAVNEALENFAKLPESENTAEVTDSE
ncbi:MAG: FMN-binding protein [Acutalibacteraceae bacterium]|nr:FMN-binding protein [Clostridia bacterium]MEE1330050.1 FMN-binding protein [Acutalibacteraceae bacterium]